MATLAASKPAGRQSKQGQKAPLSENSRLLEGLAILLLGASVFLAVALFTYDPRDPSFNRVTPTTWQVRNSAGVAGSYVADAAGQLLGAAALVFPLAGLLIGVRWIRGRRVEGRWALGAGLLIGAAVAAVLLHDPGGRADPLFSARIPAGGLLGHFLRPILFQFFGVVGGYLILSAAGVFACLQIVGLGLSDLLKGLSKASRWVGGGIRFSALSLFKGSRWLVKGSRRVLVGSAVLVKRSAVGFGRFAARSAALLNPTRIPPPPSGPGPSGGRRRRERKDPGPSPARSGTRGKSRSGWIPCPSARRSLCGISSRTDRSGPMRRTSASRKRIPGRPPAGPPPLGRPRSRSPPPSSAPDESGGARTPCRP